MQRQPTPPRLEATLPSHSRADTKEKNESIPKDHIQHEEDDDSTTDDSDHGSQPTPPIHSSPKDKSATSGEYLYRPHITPSRFLPTSDIDSTEKSHRLHHQEEKVSTQSMENPTEQSPMSNFGDQADEGQKDLAADTKIFADDNPAETSAVPKSKGKLGKIGGKSTIARDYEPNDDSYLDANSPVSKGDAASYQRIESDTAKFKSPRKIPGPARIGRVGGKVEAPPPPRESSRDRADKKREQLKRELESKSLAGAKKKRRF